MPNYSHEHLMNHFKASGFSLSRPGVCAGLVQMSIQAFLAGSKEFARFNQRLELIANSSPAELTLRVTGARQAIAERSKKKRLELGASTVSFTIELSEEERILTEIEAFFDGVELYLHPQRHQELFAQLVAQPQVQPIFPFMESEALAAEGGMAVADSFPGIYTRSSLQNYFTKLNALAHHYHPPQDLIMGLDSINHRISLCYDCKRKAWMLMDANQLPARVVEPSQLSEKVFKALAVNAGEGGSPSIAAINTIVYSTGKNEATIKRLMENVRQSEEYKAAHDITAKKIDMRTDILKVSFAQIAAKFERIDILRAIKAVKPTALHERGFVGQTAMHVAAHLNLPKVIKELVKDKVSLVNQDGEGHSPMYLAIEANSVEAVEALLEAKPDLVSTAVTTTGWLPIHFAVEKENLEIVKLLLSAKANINAIDKYGYSSLHLAINYNQNRIVRFLIGNGAKFTNTFADETVAHIAARASNIALLKQLELAGEKGEHVLNYRSTKTGLMPVQVATTLPVHQFFADRVFKKTISLFDSLQKKFEGNYACMAAIAVFENQIKRVCKHNPQFILKYQGLTPEVFLASMAIELNNSEVIYPLTQAGINFEIPNSDGLFPIHVAATLGFSQVIKALHQVNVSISKKTNTSNGMTIAHLAAEWGQKSTLQLLLHLDPSLLDALSTEGLTPLLHAVRYGHPDNISEITQVLITQGADLNAKTESDETVAHVAAANGNVALLEQLEQAGEKGKNALNYRSTNTGLIPEQIETTLLVDQFFADRVFKKSIPLFDSLQKKFEGNYACLETIAVFENQIKRECKNNPQLILNYGELTPEVFLASMAVELNNSEIIYLLTQAGINFDAPNSEGLFPIHVAATLGSSQVIKALHQMNVSISKKTNTSYGLTTAHLAAEWEHEDTLQLLLHLDPSLLDALSTEGLTPLLHAVRYGHPDNISEITQVLITQGADLNAKTESDETVAHVAATNGNLAVLKQLEQAGEKGEDALNYRSTKTGLMPWQYASAPPEIQFFTNRIFKKAIPLFASLKKKFKDNQACLAAITAFENQIKIECKINPLLILNYGELTPEVFLAFMAVEKNNSDAINALVQGGVNFNAPNPLGSAPIHVALTKIRPLNIVLVKTLLEQGVNPDTPNHLGQTLLELAISNDSVDIEIILILINSGAKLYSEKFVSILLSKPPVNWDKVSTILMTINKNDDKFKISLEQSGFLMEHRSDLLRSCISNIKLMNRTPEVQKKYFDLIINQQNVLGEILEDISTSKKSKFFIPNQSYITELKKAFPELDNVHTSPKIE